MKYIYLTFWSVWFWKLFWIFPGFFKVFYNLKMLLLVLPFTVTHLPWIYQKPKLFLILYCLKLSFSGGPISLEEMTPKQFLAVQEDYEKKLIGWLQVRDPNNKKSFLQVVNPAPEGPFRKAPWHGNVHVMKFWMKKN